MLHFLLALLFFSPLSLTGDWDPRFILEIDPQCDSSELKDPNFFMLKKKMEAYLQETWCSQEKINLIADLIALIHPRVSVEIGVFTGSSLLPIGATLKHLGKGKVYAIDPWSVEECLKNLDPNDVNYPWWQSLDMVDLKIKFNQMLIDWSLSSSCKIIQATSEEARNQIGAIDFLHLDGNFSEVGSLKDVNLYLPKVKSGGYILLSNMFMVVSGKITKMKTLWALCDECDVICEIDNSNAVLFRKR